LAVLSRNMGETSLGYIALLVALVAATGSLLI
jgi:hypothetical protein